MKKYTSANKAYNFLTKRNGNQSWATLEAAGALSLDNLRGIILYKKVSGVEYMIEVTIDNGKIKKIELAEMIKEGHYIAYLITLNDAEIKALEKIARAEVKRYLEIILKMEVLENE
jgi:hypothetical protein